MGHTQGDCLAGFDHARGVHRRSADDIVATFDDLRAVQAESSELSNRIYVRDTDDRFVIEARGARPDAAIAVFEAVRAEISVTEAYFSEREAELRVPTGTDFEAASQIAEPLWTGEPDALVSSGRHRDDGGR